MPEMFKGSGQPLYDPDCGWGEGANITPFGWVVLSVGSLLSLGLMGAIAKGVIRLLF